MARRMTRQEREQQLRRRLTIFFSVLVGLILIAVAAGVLIGRKNKPAKQAETAAEAEATAATAAAQNEETAVSETAEASETAETVTDSTAGAATGAGTESAAGNTGTAEDAAASGESPAEAVKEEVPEDLPDIDINSWEFILANPWNSIADYEPELAEFEDVELDYRIIDAMDSFVEDCRAAGNSVILTSGYRSYDTQSYLFERKVEEYGEEEAATIVARPGTSEHQTGLAADITDDYYEYKSRVLEETSMYQWMAAHCHEYGFIVRFPDGKEDITGIIYEPWHFRYVGVEAATYIMENDLTLEEFVELYK